MNAILLAGLLASSLHAAPDTTLDLRRGDRVVVDRLSGSVVVEAWDRSSVEVRATDGDTRALGLSRSGSRVSVVPFDPKGRRLEVDAVLRVPRWVDVEVRGRSLDVRVSGVEGRVVVDNVSGDIRTEHTSGEVSLSTVEGEIDVRSARGSVTAHSRGDDVRLSDVTGDVDVASGDGDLTLDGVTASSLRAETLDGDVFFRGPLMHQGRYWFSVHDGDATLAVPRDADAAFSVSTFDGEFTSEFPVTLKGYKGGGVFEFTLGRGSAQVQVKVFDGEIRLARDRTPGR
ncbi:MAG: DUF4097 family beta strand repeat-containing protein [Gemmatimonadota bacterium]|jgi:hypothetical protein